MIGMSRTTGRSISDAASHFSHLHQSIQDILTTQIGTRICRRNYGSLIPHIIDQPCNEATQLRLYSAVATALIRFEPRIKISHVKTIRNEEAYWEIEISGATTFNQQNLNFIDRFDLRVAA